MKTNPSRNGGTMESVGGYGLLMELGLPLDEKVVEFSFRVVQLLMGASKQSGFQQRPVRANGINLVYKKTVAVPWYKRHGHPDKNPMMFKRWRNFAHPLFMMPPAKETRWFDQTP